MDTIFLNGYIWDGAVGSARQAQVLVVDGKIRSIEKEIDKKARAGANVYDLDGGTLMPGMIDGHSHLSFLETANILDFGSLPVEEHLIQTMLNAQKVLFAGFTSCIGASSAKPRLDIAVRNAINARKIIGPRLLASTPEITVSGGLGDERLLHLYRESEAVVLDGPEAIRQYVRVMAREGCDVIKLTISGSSSLSHAPANATVMDEDEIAMGTRTAHRFNKLVAAHAHSSEAVQMCLKHGVDLIHHCTFADAATIEMITQHKDRVFLGPAIGQMHNLAVKFRADPGLERNKDMMALLDQLESCCRIYRELRIRGVKTLIGGDYGFSWTPHGTQANDVKHFVDYLGYSPEEALVCATAVGAEAMRMGDCLGRIKPGYIADLIAVRGRPHEDAGCLGPENIRAVMKDGIFFKGPRRFGPSQDAPAAIQIDQSWLDSQQPQ